MRLRIAAVWSSAVVVSTLAAPLFAALDVGFSTTPTRNLTDTASTPINASVNNQGSGIGDLTPNTAPYGQGLHWVGRPENHPFDEEITAAAAHTGTQSWRVSNYYASGIVPTDSTPWLNASAGETGSQDGAGQVASSHVFNATLWFRSVATSDPSPGTLANPHTTAGQWTQESFGADNGTGARWGGVMVARDRYTGDNGATYGSGVQL